MGKIKCPIHDEQLAGPVSKDLRTAILAKQLNNETIIRLLLIDLEEPSITFPVLIYEHEYEILKAEVVENNQITIDQIDTLFKPVCTQCTREFYANNALSPEKREMYLKILE
jgi:hypothetical protein